MDIKKLLLTYLAATVEMDKLSLLLHTATLFKLTLPELVIEP